MPREIVGLNITAAQRIKRYPRVVTVTPNLKRTIQYGFRALLDGAAYDHGIICPSTQNKARAQKALGQILIETPFAREYAEVYVDDVKDPVVFSITNDRFLRENLYPHAGEDETATMKRIVFFNKASLTLLMEAEIDPRILHCVDWPTALAIAYMKMDRGFSAASLFTFMDAAFPGNFSRDTMALTGLAKGDRSEVFMRKFLEYYSEISLAKLGMLMADLTITSSKEHIDKVMSGIRGENEDWGEFTDIFKQLYTKGRLHFIAHTHRNIPALSRLNHSSPSPAELDTLLDLAAHYVLSYTKLVPPTERDLAKVTAETLQQLVVRGTEIDFEILAILQKILKSDFFSTEEKALIEKVCHDFGSIELVNFLSSRLEKLQKNNLSERESAKIKFQIRNLLSQIQELKIDWALFRDIARKTFFGKPKTFIRPLETIDAYPLSENRPDVIKAGIDLLSSGKGRFSPLMVLSLSGGLGQRFGFSITIAHENKIIGIPAQILNEKINDLLSQEQTSQIIDKRGDAIWQIPQDKFEKIKTGFDSPFLRRIAQMIEETRQKSGSFVSLPKGIFIAGGQPLSFFEQQARSIARLEKSTGKTIFWTIMTSSDNHEIVKLYFESSLRDGKYFGILDASQVLFIPQRNNPAIQKAENLLDIFIQENGKIYTAATGHGGFYEAAGKAVEEILETHRHQVEEILACNVDNLLFNHQLGNLQFIASWLGFKKQRNDQITGLAATKASPQEPMGVFGKGDNVEQILEYSHPTFSVLKAFVYESEKEGEIFFVRGAKGRVLVMDQRGLTSIFKSPPGEENWTEEIGWDDKTNQMRGGKMLEGYTLIGLPEITEDELLHPTTLEDDRLTISGSPFPLKDLGETKLKYRQGNTNIFVMSSAFVELVLRYPEISLKEEFASGSTPHPGVKKVESAIFGPLANIIDYEHLREVLQRFNGALGISVVEADREECFEPIKDPEDVETARAALEEFLRRHPELDLSEI